jgi:acetyl esterase/lipase
MSWQLSTRRLGVVIAMVTGALAISCTLPGTRALSVDPPSGLVDGQRVTVTGTGFAPGSTTVFQCRAGLVGVVDCDLGTATSVTVGPDGTFQVDQQVFTVIRNRFEVDCRVAGSCVLAADVGFDGGASSVIAPVEFDADAALLPAPTITVTPGAELVDRQIVTVEGRGFVHRQSAVPIEAPYTLGVFQCGRFVAFTDCRIGPIRTVEVQDNGTFRAEVAVSARITTSLGELVDCRQGTDPCHLGVSPGQLGSMVMSVATELRFDPGATLPEWPNPTIALSAEEPLHDFNHLSIRGESFTPGGQVDVEVCRVDDPSTCDFATLRYPTADGAGDLAADVPVWSSFDALETVDCRTAPGCALRAVDRDRGVVASAPLAFGPVDPPRGRYQDPVFDDVRVDRDVIYRETFDYLGRPVQLKMDIYRPAGDTATSRPTIVLMHGGFFIAGDKTEMRFAATAFAQLGYVGVALEYRLRPGGLDRRGMYLASLDAYDDAVAGVAWLTAHASEYGIDPDAVVAGGYSAGAVTALNLAYLPGQRGPRTSPIAAAAPDSGVIYTVPERGEPPTIAFHGTMDPITAYENVSGMCAQARRAGVVCEVVPFAHLGHGGGGLQLRRLSSDFFAEHVLRPQGYFDVAADAGGPYVVDEGSTVTLDGSASAGEDLVFAWSPGERVDDPATARPTLTGRDDGNETLELAVTSSHGISADDHAQVTTRNVRPSLTSVETTVSDGRSVSLTGSVTDPGLADTHRAEIDWGDGTVEPATVDQRSGGATVSGSHAYAEPGGYEVSITVTDDDGGATTAVQDVAVGCTVVGTSADDHLIGTRGDDVICGLGGDDVLEGRSGDDRLYGGTGHDRLRGGRGSDVLVGGSGRDRADGQQGHDICDAETRRSCHRPAQLQ